MTVKPTVSRLRHFKYRTCGKEKLLSFGIYPDVTLAAARIARDAARAFLEISQDPGDVKQDRKREDTERRGCTFASQAAACAAKNIKEGKATATLTKTEWLIGMANADFGSKPITDMTAPKILRCLRKVEAKGNYEITKRLRATIGAAFCYPAFSLAQDCKDLRLCVSACLHSKSPRSYCRENSTFAAPYFRGGLPLNSGSLSDGSSRNSRLVNSEPLDRISNGPAQTGR